MALASRLKELPTKLISVLAYFIAPFASANIISVAFLVEGGMGAPRGD
jgi:hypothetical protein